VSCAKDSTVNVETQGRKMTDFLSNKHWDVCPAMLTIGLCRLALLLMREMSVSIFSRMLSE
jgi:hypothetical protein